MFRRCALWAGLVTASDVHAALRVLGVPAGSQPDDVRKRYLKLARESHPDINGGDDSKMKMVNLAYETVQQHGHLATPIPARGAEGGGDGGAGAGAPNRYKQQQAERQKQRRAAMDHTAWNTRSEFDWAAALTVEPEESSDPVNHPHTFNKTWSHDDDTTLWMEVRSGADVAQVARLLNKTPLQVELRLNSAQFKLRMQKMLAKDKEQKDDARRSRIFRQAAEGHKRVVRRTAMRDTSGAAISPEHDDVSAVDALGFKRRPDPRELRFDPRQMASPMGHYYANQRQHGQQR